jgi:hypothetical protein
VLPAVQEEEGRPGLGADVPQGRLNKKVDAAVFGACGHPGGVGGQGHGQDTGPRLVVPEGP